MDQNSQNTVMINNSGTTRPTYILMLFLSSLDNLPSDVHIILKKRVLIILRQSTKHANFWLGVQFPLNNI